MLILPEVDYDLLSVILAREMSLEMCLPVDRFSFLVKPVGSTM